MEYGVGATSSALYLACADDLEALEEYPQAVQVLKNGINQKAQPIEYLEDALRYLDMLSVFTVHYFGI